MKNLNISRSSHAMPDQKVFRIIILEDSEFFNDLLTRQLEHYAAILSMEKNCRFEIHSYTSPSDFIRNLKNDTGVAFVDYYLGNGITGADMIKKIREKCWDCKIVIVSQARNVKITSLAATDASIDFIFKDINVLPKCCFILEDSVDSSFSRYELN